MGILSGDVCKVRGHLLAESPVLLRGLWEMQPNEAMQAFGIVAFPKPRLYAASQFPKLSAVAPRHL